MGIVKVRKNYHQARWDEPMIFELSTPGVRGILPPEPEKEIADAVGDVAGKLPAGIRRKKPPARGRLAPVLNYAISRRRPWAQPDADIGAPAP
jgi:hypothetical protein